ncbi:MAG: hypothetical protein MAG431_00703 [Chloroflexi bacterium]|nr:hypothetical protein [Chloroflexota bacterium]
MAFNESEIKKYSQILDEFCQKHGPPPRIHDKLKWEYKIENQSVFLLEVRPRWDNPEEQTKFPYFKTTFVKTSQTWKLYWRRANGRWDRYDPYPTGKSLREILEIVKEDKHQCFFG